MADLRKPLVPFCLILLHQENEHKIYFGCSCKVFLYLENGQIFLFKDIFCFRGPFWTYAKKVFHCHRSSHLKSYTKQEGLRFIHEGSCINKELPFQILRNSNNFCSHNEQKLSFQFFKNFFT